MQIILQEDVEKLGNRGQLVEVAEGYARNFLLPRKLALEATDGNLKRLERMRATFAKKEATEREAAQKQADALSGVLWGRYLDRARAVLARRPLLAAEQEAVTSADQTVAYVNPAEAAQFLAELQALIGRYQHRLADQSLRPADAMALELLLFTYPLDAVPPGA